MTTMRRMVDMGGPLVGGGERDRSWAPVSSNGTNEPEGEEIGLLADAGADTCSTSETRPLGLIW